MPHQRPRHLLSLLKKTLKFSPITGVLGHRQVGKTTLVSCLAKEYTSLDLAETLALASTSPTAFLAKHHKSPVVIDECQLAPPLFPALKEWIRINPKPGQYILTGSVRFTSRRAIRESLTGRIVTWELLPMDWSEQHDQPLPDTLLRLLAAHDLRMPLRVNTTFNAKNYERSLNNGGLPGVFSVREASIRTQRYETQISTILDRDLRLILQTTLAFRTLRALLTAVAAQAGSPLSLAKLERATRISQPTLRKLLSALEALFMIRFVPVEGDYSKPLLFFEDIGERNHLLGTAPVSGHLLSFLYQNLRTQFHYRPEEQVEIFAFRDRAGHEAPLCFRSKKGILGLIPLEREEDLSRAHADAQVFLKRYRGSKAVIVSVDDQDQLLEPRIRWLGAGRLL